MEELPTGANRSKMFTETIDSKFPPRFDLLPFEGLRRWAEAFGEGTLKYGDGNFRKGFEDRCLLQHALAHLFLYQAGDKTEDHLGHAMWNIGQLCKMEKERPELLVLQKQIAEEYDCRERPIYATDDPRLPKGMDKGMMSDTCNGASPVPPDSDPFTYERAKELLIKAHDTFIGYGRLHDRKNTPEGREKAVANYRLAAEIADVVGIKQ